MTGADVPTTAGMEMLISLRKPATAACWGRRASIDQVVPAVCMSMRPWMPNLGPRCRNVWAVISSNEPVAACKVIRLQEEGKQTGWWCTEAHERWKKLQTAATRSDLVAPLWEAMVVMPEINVVHWIYNLRHPKLPHKHILISLI